MEKAVVTMRNWELYVYDNRYNLSGVADKHPSLGKDVYISYTTNVERSELVEDVLTYETRNTIYMCPLKFMTRHPYGNVVEKYIEELTHRGDNSESELDGIIAATACIALEEGEKNQLAKHIMELQEIGMQELKMQEEVENKRLMDIVKRYEDSVYIEVSNVDCGNRLAYHLGEEYGIVKPSVHSGMFQDSILYMQYATEENNNCSLDFRYFPKGLGDVMETYSWSDNIKQAIIKNECNHIIYFNKTELTPGETKVFTPQSHRQGLISPDCHNGKCVLFSNPLDGFFDELESIETDE